MKQLTKKAVNLLLVMILVPVLSGCGLGFGQALGGLLILAAGGAAAISDGRGGRGSTDDGVAAQGASAPDEEGSFLEITRINPAPEKVYPEPDGSGGGEGNPPTITNPEPASVFLLGGGMLGAAFLKRRRKK
jgi:hypothetical protein